jgi:glycosyltransferase involved in cell wall biosynthesis
VISGLGVGGAERSLLNLASSLSDRFDFAVANLSPGGGLRDRFVEAGVSVFDCPMRPNPFTGWRMLRRALDGYAPDLLQGWMSWGQLATGMLQRAGCSQPLVWSVRNDAGSLVTQRWIGRQAVRLTGSGLFAPAVVIYNSEAGRGSYGQCGYDRYPGVVIPNGIDSGRFAPSCAARQALRNEVGCVGDEPLVGYVGRDHRVKDIPTLVRAFAQIRAACPRARFVMAGSGLEPSNVGLADLIRRSGLSDAVSLLGTQDDLSGFYPGLDLLVLSSRFEGLPNVLLEAMCSAVPCVSTDAGDAVQIIGSRDRVVGVGDSERLASSALGILTLPTESRESMGAACRRRVVERYGIERCANAFADLYLRMIGR